MPRLQEAVWTDAARRYMNGESACSIARSLGVSKPSVLYQLRQRKLEIRKAAEVRRALVLGRYVSPTEKHCGECGKVKPLNEYGHDQSRSDGLNRKCKSCVKAQNLELTKRRTPEQKSRRTERMKEYRAERRNDPAIMAEEREYRRTTSRKPRARFTNCRARAKRVGMLWTLTFDEFAALISQACTYCGGPLPETATGLDRLDNSRGYEPDNVVACCAPCNYARRDQFTPDEMRRFIGPAIRAVRESRAIRRDA